MKFSEANRLTQKLEAKLAIIIKGLKEVSKRAPKMQSEHWQKWMETCLLQIQNNDLHGIRKFQSAFGGMGSFNDAYPYYLKQTVEEAGVS